MKYIIFPAFEWVSFIVLSSSLQILTSVIFTVLLIQSISLFVFYVNAVFSSIVFIWFFFHNLYFFAEIL